MDFWLQEHVFPVAARSTQDIGALAATVVRTMQPEVFSGAAVDVLRLVEALEPAVFFCPALAGELQNEEGKTQVSLRGAVEVSIRNDQWDAVCTGAGPLYTRGRATIAHECGHVYLHVEEYRRRALSLNRSKPVARTEIKPYVDPEWQAWTFANALLMPPSLVRELPRDPNYLANRFAVSTDFVEAMLKRFARFL